MKENDFMNDGSSEKNTYHATSNLNTAIENPQINMNSVVGVNIKNVDPNSVNLSNVSNDNYSPYQEENLVNNNEFENTSTKPLDLNSEFYDQNVSNQNVNAVYQPEKVTSQFIPTPSEMNYEPIVGNDNVSYEPTMQEKKRRDKKFRVSREFKMILFIVFILFIFLLIMPYIYDFMQKLFLEF